MMFCCGCAHDLAEQMVAAPNNRLGADRSAPVGATAPAMDETHFMVTVGPPKAELAVWVMEPRTQVVRGTILMLHGFVANHNFVRNAAEVFCAAGYRAVLVDLRGHGESTGDHVTFGVVESRDMVQVTDYLQAHHLAGAKVGVYGTSLGAAIAIEYAGIDPRVSSVVAVAPFATLKEEAPRFGRTMVPMPGLFMSPTDYAEVLKDAGEIGEFDPASASPLAAIGRTKARVLLIHGALDNVIPHEDSEQLHAAAPANSELKILPAHGHMTACLDLTGEVPRLAREFFERNLKP
jgi:pimeloyl-ACP methyl ester carboxylesterase